MPDTFCSPADRQREATRWRIASSWSVPLHLITGDTEDEMNAAAAAHRPEWCLPGMNERR